MLSSEGYWLNWFTTAMISGLLVYAALALYAYVVRDRENFLVQLAMVSFSFLSFSMKAQVLVSLIFVFFGVQFYHADQIGLAKAMWISSIFVFIFHSAQPTLYEWGKRNGLT